MSGAFAPTTARVRMLDIARLASDLTLISLEDIRGPRKLRPLVKARAMIYWVGKLNGRTVSEMGRALCGHDHTSVIHLVRRADEFAREDPVFARQLRHLRYAVAETYPGARKFCWDCGTRIANGPVNFCTSCAVDPEHTRVQIIAAKQFRPKRINHRRQVPRDKLRLYDNLRNNKGYSAAEALQLILAAATTRDPSTGDPDARFQEDLRPASGQPHRSEAHAPA